MEKKRKGISLIALVVTIAITVILASVIVIQSGDIINKTTKSSFAKEIYTIQNLVKQYNFRNGKYPVSGDLDLNLSDIDPNFAEQFSSEPGYSNGTIKLQYIDLYEADIETTTRGTKEGSDETDVYVVSENTGIVYYLKGELIGGNIYYTLNQELKSLIGK